MPKGSFGNLIALPLHGERARHGCTVFLDPTTMETWPDQWAFLSTVSRMSPDAVVALADSLRPVAAGPGLSLADLANVWAEASAGHRRATRRDAVDPSGGSSTRTCCGVETSGITREPRVLREGTDAVLHLGHTPVHPLLSRRPRMDPPPPGPARQLHRADRDRREPTRYHRPTTQPSRNRNAVDDGATSASTRRSRSRSRP